MKIYGVGTAKLKHFAEPFLSVVTDYCDERDIEEQTELLDQKSEPKYSGELHEQVAKAFNDGQSIEHLAEQKGVKPASIIRLLKKYLEEGNPLRAEGIAQASSLSRRKRDEVLQAFEDKGTRMLRAVYDALDKSIGYSELRVLQLYVQAKEKEG